MRKNYITLSLTLLFFTSFDSFAQFPTGTSLLGGDFGFSFSNSDDFVNSNNNSKAHSLIISPVYAKAIKENLFLGGSLGYGFAKSEYTNGETQSTILNASVFLRKYKPVIGKFYGFVQVGLNAGRSESETKQGVDFNQKGNVLNVYASITPGISVGIGKKIYVEAGFMNVASLGYGREKQTGYNFGSIIDRESTGFQFSSSLSTTNAGLFFGTRFILN